MARSEVVLSRLNPQHLCVPFGAPLTCLRILTAESTKAREAAKRWIAHREKGRFLYSTTQLEVAGYEVVVPKDTKAWFSIHQQDEREGTAQKYIDIGLTILASDRKTLIASSGVDVDRQIQLETTIKAGRSTHFFV
jgi:hypothetical protein